MNMLKKYWYLFLVALFTVGLGVVVFLTNQKLAQTESISPTAPEGEAEAAVPKACVLKFTISGEGPTPTPEDTETPTPTPTPQDISYDDGEEESSEEIAYVQPTATPIPPAECDDSCTINSDCESGLVCVEGSCRNPSCTAATNCVCDGTPQPTPKTPVSGGPTILGASVIGIGMLILLLGFAL